MLLKFKCHSGQLDVGFFVLFKTFYLPKMFLVSGPSSRCIEKTKTNLKSKHFHDLTKPISKPFLERERERERERESIYMYKC